jgi:hypothetical protein
VPLLHTPASSEGFNLTVTPDPQRQKEMKKLAGQEEGGTCQTEIKSQLSLTLVRPDRVGRATDQKKRFGSCMERLHALADVLREKRNAPGSAIREGDKGYSGSLGWRGEGRETRGEIRRG